MKRRFLASVILIMTMIFVDCSNQTTDEPKNTNADLSTLTVESGVLIPEFSTGVTDYTVNVANSVNSVLVSGTASDAKATVSDPVTLSDLVANVPKTATIIVTAQDGTTTKSYTVAVKREVSSLNNNANLDALNIDSETTSPLFAANTTSYWAWVPNTITAITVSITLADTNASVIISPTQPSSLSVGSNTISVDVTAQDGITKKTYSINVYKNSSTPDDYVSTNIGMLKGVPSGAFQRSGTTPSISTVSSFHISEKEITRTQYTAITHLADPSFESCSTGTTDPVQNINWHRALIFCNMLSSLEGLTPVYTIKNSTNPEEWGSVPTSSNTDWDSPTVDWNATGYRLPTEMEWEWAAMGARSGIIGYAKSFAGSTGNNAMDDYAWYSENSLSKTHPVGTKLSNELGIYDMTGNAEEWCWDWYAAYPEGTLVNYIGNDSGVYRVRKGGTFGHYAADCKLSNRSSGEPFEPGASNLNPDSGFRVVRP